MNYNNISDPGALIDFYTKMNREMYPIKSSKGIGGTSIPYQYSSISNIIVNQSTVSISEFQKMVDTQPIISTGLTVLINLIKNKVGRFIHPNKKYEDFINNMIDTMDRSFQHEIIPDMLTALYAGFFIGEKKNVVDKDLRVITKDILPRPAQSILFEVDDQGNVADQGIIQYYFNSLSSPAGNSLSSPQYGMHSRSIPNPLAPAGDLDYPWRTVYINPFGAIRLKKMNCIHFTYKGVNGFNYPYGRSLLRNAYDYYVKKCELMLITRNAAHSASSVTPVITTDPNQKTDENGYDIQDHIKDALRNISQVGGAPALLLKGKLGETIDISQLNHPSNLDQYVALNKYYDSMMLTSVLYPSELAGLSDKGSYGLGKSQQNLLDMQVDSTVGHVQDVLIRQFIKPLLVTNFNEQEDFGSFSITDNVAADISLNMQKIQVLKDNGIKLKPDSMMELLDLESEMIESINNPIIADSQGLDITRVRGIA